MTLLIVADHPDILDPQRAPEIACLSGRADAVGAAPPLRQAQGAPAPR